MKIESLNYLDTPAFKALRAAEKAAWKARCQAYRALVDNTVEPLEAGLEQAYRAAHAAWEGISRAEIQAASLSPAENRAAASLAR